MAVFLTGVRPRPCVARRPPKRCLGPWPRPFSLSFATQTGTAKRQLLPVTQPARPLLLPSGPPQHPGPARRRGSPARSPPRPPSLLTDSPLRSSEDSEMSTAAQCPQPTFSSAPDPSSHKMVPAYRTENPSSRAGCFLRRSPSAP